MIELLIAIAIVGILTVIGAPSFRHWLLNNQIRSSAEATFNGLQLARAEAVRRNTTARFQLTTTVTADCALSTSGTNWVISLDDPSGACANAPSDTVAPRIIQTRSSGEGSANAVVAAGQSAIIFNGLGRVTPVPAGDINIDVTNPAGGACISASGPMRCLRVTVSTGGQVRMCDTSISSADPRGC